MSYKIRSQENSRANSQLKALINLVEKAINKAVLSVGHSIEENEKEKILSSFRKSAKRLMPGHAANAWLCDRAMIAEAYLAEHPADEDEPVTEEWLRSVGFVRVVSDRGPEYSDHFQLARLNIWKFNDTPNWLFNDADWIALQTRGDIRRFCAVVGVELKASVPS